MKRITILFTALALILGLCACSAKVEELTWQEQYDLGIRYLSEGNYQEAIIAFTAAIEIDPKQAPAYVGRGDAHVGIAQVIMEGVESLTSEAKDSYTDAISDYLFAIDLDDSLVKVYLKAAEAYVEIGDVDTACDILNSGYEVTKDQSILDQINKLVENWRGVDPREWALQSPISPNELTIEGIPFYQLSIYDVQEIYPGSGIESIFTGSSTLSYSPAYIDNENNTTLHGSLQFSQELGQEKLTVVTYNGASIVYDNWTYEQYQPEFRQIILGENYKSTLQKLGFTDAGIYYIQTKLEDGTGGNFGNNPSIYFTRYADEEKNFDIRMVWNYKTEEEINAKSIYLWLEFRNDSLCVVHLQASY